MQPELFSVPVKNKTKKLEAFPYQYAREAVSSFEKGSRLIGLTKGQFSLIDLIVALLDKTGPANIVCCTWSAGIKDAKQMHILLNSGKINSFTLVTDYSYSTRQKQYAITVEELFGKENIRTTDIHAKFVLIQNENYNVCIRTSMNLNANRKCENYEIDDDKEVFDFYMNFIEDIFGAMPKGFCSDFRIVRNAMNSYMGDDREAEAIAKEDDFSFASDGFKW